MDRLAEISRPQTSQRNDATDFTRPQGTRAERRDDVETRAEDRMSERERTERASDKTERFAVHLAEQNASLAPQPGTDVAAEAESASANALEPTHPDADVEKHDAEPQAEPAQAHVVAPKSTNAPAEPPLAPPIEGHALDLPAAAEALAKPDSKPAAAITPPVLAPTALPVATSAAVPAGGSQPTAIGPAVATAPRQDSEKPALESESSTAKIGAPRPDGHANQVQDQGSTREKPVEAPQVEAPREAPLARSAHEVERAAEILRQIRVQITPQINEARIQLQPLELGRVSIHLTLENGRMKTTVRAEKTETLQAIQTHLPELRASLRQHGIDAQEFQLSLGFENRPARDGDNTPAQPNTRNTARDTTAIERSPSLHAAVTKTGVDFYA
jgi:flagellar hook-length control protein FliK